MRHVEARRGVTLLELIVVVALLGLVLAIAAPSFIVPKPPDESDVARAIDTGRRAALLRGEPVTLSLARDGSWRVDGDASAGTASIASGSFDGPTIPLRVHISALGTCIPESIDGSPPPTWNVTACAPLALPNTKAAP
ncbi:MAG TPA: prepilin-type N-terminal cleavage/methylation domain-containing protein [Gemmatimonadaceae bacterium]|nr:prepilin-type N-terminal cleavage/methylation domain-containing protein [Gemmatimonadaceae bacterium]